MQCARVRKRVGGARLPDWRSPPRSNHIVIVTRMIPTPIHTLTLGKYLPEVTTAVVSLRTRVVCACSVTATS